MSEPTLICRHPYGWEYWYDGELYGYNENRDLVYYKNFDGYEYWWEYDENNKSIAISQHEFEQIKAEREEQEFLSREPVSIFELMEI